MNRRERRRAEALRPRIARGLIPAEDIDLAWSLIPRAMAEDKAGERGCFYDAWRAVVGANRFVAGKRLVALAEELRTSDLGVTINSLGKGWPFPGRSWLEWDAAIPGRAEPLPHQVRHDRAGVLIEADEMGHRGIVHVFHRAAPAEGQAVGVADMGPLSVTFDLREAYERPRSLVEPASVEGVRRIHAAAEDPTPSELEGSPVAAAAMSRRFGVVENPYCSEFMHRIAGSGERRWHEMHPDLFESAIEEAMTDVSLMVCVFIVLRTAGVEVTQVLKGTRRKAPTYGIDTALLGYGIFESVSCPGPEGPGAASTL